MTKADIIKNWSIAQKSEAVLPCPRCGRYKMGAEISDNALSRIADIYVCSSCGMEEGIEAMISGNTAESKNNALSSWWLVKTMRGKPPADGLGNFTLKIERDVYVTQEDIDDIMAGALEGGCNYWCDEVRVAEDKYLGEFASEQISRGGSLIFHDAEEYQEYTLTLEKFLSGLVLALNNGYGDGRWLNEEGTIDCGCIDAIGADVIIQFALFEEVIYG